MDLCWDHGMAVRRRFRLPATLEGIVAGLRAATWEAGLPGRERMAFYSSFEAAVRGRRDDEETRAVQSRSLRHAVIPEQPTVSEGTSRQATPVRSAYITPASAARSGTRRRPG